MFRRHLSRGGSRTTASSKMELFVIIVNDFQPLTIITQNSILDVAVVVDLPLLRRLLKVFLRRTYVLHLGMGVKA